MKEKYIMHWCTKCRDNTKWQIFRKKNKAEEIFCDIISLGMNLITFRTYEAECTKCGKIEKLKVD